MIDRELTLPALSVDHVCRIRTPEREGWRTTRPRRITDRTYVGVLRSIASQIARSRDDTMATQFAILGGLRQDKEELANMLGGVTTMLLTPKSSKIQPDLVIEIEVSRSSLPRFPIFAAFGVPEVWRYDGTRVSVWRLEAGQYVESERSVALPLVTGPVATRFLEESRTLPSTEWVRRVREWARSRP